MNINVILNQMLVLFLVMVIGYIASKKEILDVNVNKRISSLLLNITAPALILSSVLNKQQAGDPTIVVSILILGILLFMTLPFIGVLLAKILNVPKEDKKLYQFMTIFGNIGFMGFPVIDAIFGSEAVFLAALINLIFNIFCFSYGVYLVSDDKKITFDLKVLLNPGIIISIIALIIYITNIQLPYLISQTSTLVGNITTPLAMMLIGSSLAEIPVKEVFSNRKLYPFTFIKQIIIPIIIFFILKPFVTNQMVLGIIIVLAAMPTGTIAIMFCNEYGGNVELASKTIFITTLCSVITIPALVYILFT